MSDHFGRKSMRFLTSKYRKQPIRNASHSVVGLETLPDELLHHIFELVSPVQSVCFEYQRENCFWEYKQPVDLLNLIRCSHRLYFMGIPFLYNTFVQAEPSLWVPYVRTLLITPDLTSFVQNLKLSSRRYYEISIDVQDVVSAENTQLMHYYMETRTIDDQIAVLSLENSLSGANQIAPLRSQPTTAKTGGSRLTAKESLVQAQSGCPTLPPLRESFTERFKRRAASMRFRQNEDAAHKDTGLPVSHDTETIVRNLIADDWKAMLTYLVYRLPHLHSLTIEEDKYRPRSRDMEEIISRALSPSAITISKLKKLIVIFTRRTNSSKFAHYWPLLLQPSLRSFSATKCQEYGWVPEPRNLTLPLTHLSFARCNLSTSSIDAFLKCCPYLTYLYYEHEQTWGEQPFIPHSFANSIRHLQPTLQHLTLLRPDLMFDLVVTQTNNFSILGDVLKGFESLKSIDITAHLLLGPQRGEKYKWYAASTRHVCPSAKLDSGLPVALENLRLRDCSGDVWKDVTQLATSKKSAVPKLRTVEVAFLDKVVVAKGTDIGGDYRDGEREGDVEWLKNEVIGDVEMKGIYVVETA